MFVVMHAPRLFAHPHELVNGFARELSVRDGPLERHPIGHLEVVRGGHNYSSAGGESPARTMPLKSTGKPMAKPDPCACTGNRLLK